MVALRSSRQDRALLAAVWVLTLVVLGLGIATLSPVLLLWGAVGLPGAVLLTRVHLRDTRGPGTGTGTGQAGAGVPRNGDTGDTGDTGGSDDTGNTDNDVEDVEEESQR